MRRWSGQALYRRRRRRAALSLLAVLGLVAFLLFSWSSGGEVPEPNAAPEPRQAGPPPSEIARPGFYPARYEISARYTEGPPAIAGTQKVRYVNAEGRPMGTLHFRLWTNAEDYAALGGGTEISSVAVGGVPARFSVDGTDLEVVLPELLLEDAAAEVTIGFTTKIPQLPATFGHDAGVSYLGVWHPVLAVHDAEGWRLNPPTPFGEPYFSEAADYRVELTLPKNLALVATGTETGARASGDLRTVSYEAESVRDFALAVGGELATKSRRVNETTVKVHYRPASAARADHVLALAANSLAYFSHLYGPYPYPELDVVDAPIATGAEFSTLAFANMATVEDTLLDVVVPHEVAHQWWYVQVGSDQFEHPWLDEALATYSEWLFAGDAETRFPETTTPVAPLNSPVSAFPDLASYQHTTYLYGAQLYRDLSHEIGEEALIQGLRSYAEEHRFGTATQEDLVESLSQAARTDLAPFFRARGVAVNGNPWTASGQQEPDD